ncbi:ribosomal protein S20 [Aedoeadaptatus coxii]|uniref:Small ribosomal subunit protein bS20 n=1 Tax=Aedoeadaptatus coxii TaxID=755172 RepID=A0A134AH03_9FIRM|nr:30S ribosomal protein S20 [Peptoniphilus coxii]KXB67006.1 ribosomal protein S20 [Peptoniphilus coxii]CAC9929155.1 ribosomal protein S20 [Peptoniphilus coxii]
MANIKSAIKRIGTTKKETLRNKSVKTNVKTTIRKFETALDKGNLDEARELLQVVDKTLKNAASKNVIHKNAASRRLSRLTKKLNKVK